mgnify:CR=1 FL=1|tara:strand:+ start:135 stop:344 length:210 start_codon:yes stop_codon:yes gene_type:complete
MINRFNPSCDVELEDYYDEAEEVLIEEYVRRGGADKDWFPSMDAVQDMAYELWQDRFNQYADYRRAMDG